MPLLVVFAANIARVGLTGSSSRPSPTPPAPQILREMRHTDLEMLMDVPEPVIPVLPDDVSALLEEAQALENSASALQSLPGGPLTDEVRRMLRETVLADLSSLQRALKLYRRCAAAQPDAELRHNLERLRVAIGRKRSLLLDLMRAGSRGPD